MVENATRETYDKIDRAVGWPAAPAPAEAHTGNTFTQSREKPLTIASAF